MHTLSSPDSPAATYWRISDARLRRNFPLLLPREAANNHSSPATPVAVQRLVRSATFLRSSAPPHDGMTAVAATTQQAMTAKKVAPVTIRSSQMKQLVCRVQRKEQRYGSLSIIWSFFGSLFQTIPSQFCTTMLPTIAVLIRDNAVGSVKLSSFEGKQQAPDSNTPVVLIFFCLTTLLISSSTAVADNSLRVAQQQQQQKKTPT